MFWRAENAELTATLRRAAHSGAWHRRSLLVGAILLLALVNQAGVIFSAGPQAAPSGPAALSTYLGTHFATAYTQATRLAGEMRLLYQITRLEKLELQPAGADRTTSTPRAVLCTESAAAAGGQSRKART